MTNGSRPACNPGVHSSVPDDDDTVRLIPAAKKPPLLTSRRAWMAGAGVVGTACLLGAVRVLMPPSPPVATRPALAPLAPAPEFAIRTATEPEILSHVATGLTIFRFADDQRVLVLDFATLYQQGMMLNRVAALIEKAGSPRNRVLTDAELAQVIRAGGDTVETYYYGHDYSAASLGRFFALADGEHIALDSDEDTLRHLLEREGWFEPGVQAGLISIPAVGANSDITLSARRTILHHELSHGVFFSDPDYASFVLRFWDSTLTGNERAAVRRFLGSEGYDTGYEELMYNEMQAYLMFTRDPEFFRPELVSMRVERLAELQDEFLRGMPTGWLHDALAATPVMAGAATSAEGPPAGRGVHHVRAD